MIQKFRLELTPEQVRERSDRAGLRPYIADIIDFNTHIHTKYLVFAEHPTVAIDMARKHGFHARGSAGTATSLDTAFITHIIGQIGKLTCENADVPCTVSIAEPSYVETVLDTIVPLTTVSGNLE